MEERRASQKETGKQPKKTGSRFKSPRGRMVALLVDGRLPMLLHALGIEVRHTLPNTQASFVKDDGGVQQKWFDIVAGNESETVVVEVATQLTPDKVSRFLSEMEDFKRYFPFFRHKTVYGAVAYLSTEPEAKLYAERQGLYVVRVTGDSTSIVNAAGFRPKAFPSEQAAS